MKIKVLITLLVAVAFVTQSCHQNTEQLLIGTWEITDTKIEHLGKYLKDFKEKFGASDKEIKLEEARIKALPKAYYPEGITMAFKEDGKFELGGIEGRWTYDDKEKKLLVSMAIMDTTVFYIKKISKKELVLLYPYRVSDLKVNFEIKLLRAKEEE